MVWAVSFSRWTLVTDAALVGELARVYQSVLHHPGQTLPEPDLKLAQFLAHQGALCEQPTPSIAAPDNPWSLRSFSPATWDALSLSGIYQWGGDSEDPGWLYHYRQGETPCPGCLWRHRIEHGVGARWLEFLRLHPNLELRWPPSSRPAPAGQPEPGQLLIPVQGRRSWERVWLLPHRDCPCGVRLRRHNRHWRSWTHPQFGPLRQVVEEGGELWSVSLSLPPARSSGARPDRAEARGAAVGEAMERWGALEFPLDCGIIGERPADAITPDLFTARQTSAPGFPLRQQGVKRWVRVRRVLPEPHQFASAWAGQVALTIGQGEVQLQELLSHGLACGRSWSEALSSGIWELIERDAVTRWWAALCAHRPVDTWRHPSPSGSWLWSVPALSGRCYLALVGARGQGAWGSAAGPQAPRRALEEAGHNARVFAAHPPRRRRPVETFADHSGWGWWEACPGWKRLEALSERSLPDESCETWRSLARRSPFYACRLPDHYARAAGLKILRVLNPELLLLPVHELAWPLAHPTWEGMPAPRNPHPFS